MAQARSWIRRKLSPNTVHTLQSMRHASTQMLAGPDLWQLRLDLERRIEARLRETEAAQDVQLMAAVREELTSELDRWSQDMMDRMDILLGASNRLVGSLEARIAELERRLMATSGDTVNGHAGTTKVAAPQAGAGS